jgi:hypothetical protein
MCNISEFFEKKSKSDELFLECAFNSTTYIVTLKFWRLLTTTLDYLSVLTPKNNNLCAIEEMAHIILWLTNFGHKLFE